VRALIAVLFFLLTGWFLADPDPGIPPVEPTPTIDPSALSTAPPRVRLLDPPTVTIAGIEQRCTDCHMIFPSRRVTPDRLYQHTDLVHDHGMNDRCFNCHALENRDKLVLHDGTEIGYDQVEQLCAKCHGTVYRDWQAGTHGRTQGSWGMDSPDQWRLTCSDCHDPHSPAYEPMAPLPGPRTFRMGPVHPREVHDERNPLRRHLQPDYGVRR